MYFFRSNANAQKQKKKKRNKPPGHRPRSGFPPLSRFFCQLMMPLYPEEKETAFEFCHSLVSFTFFTCNIFCSSQLQLGKSWQRKLWFSFFFWLLWPAPLLEETCFSHSFTFAILLKVSVPSPRSFFPPFLELDYFFYGLHRFMGFFKYIKR